jgi:hypothetical protein
MQIKLTWVLIFVIILGVFYIAGSITFKAYSLFDIIRFIVKEDKSVECSALLYTKAMFKGNDLKTETALGDTIRRSEFDIIIRNNVNVSLTIISLGIIYEQSGEHYPLYAWGFTKIAENDVLDSPSEGFIIAGCASVRISGAYYELTGSQIKYFILKDYKDRKMLLRILTNRGEIILPIQKFKMIHIN